MKLQQKPVASLSLDLDNQWSYLKVHGDLGWETYPSYFDLVIPRILSFLRERNLTVTFFVVGKDAALTKNWPTLQQIAVAGHEIGNHSFHHDPELHLWSELEIEQEIALAEQSIYRATGERPIGFRGPGYSFSPAVLRVLAKLNYQYDASTFPTFLGPIARAYYLMTSKFSPEEKTKRKALFGRFSDGLKPVKPYYWQIDGDRLVEIPVTTLPLFKVPIHLTYILYLSIFSPTLALLYFRLSLWLCKLTRTPPSLLLHPLDFLTAEEVPELAFFPGMSLPSDKKLAVLGKAIELLSNQFTVLPVGQHAQWISKTSCLPRFHCKKCQ